MSNVVTMLSTHNLWEHVISDHGVWISQNGCIKSLVQSQTDEITPEFAGKNIIAESKTFTFLLSGIPMFYDAIVEFGGWTFGLQPTDTFPQ